MRAVRILGVIAGIVIVVAAVLTALTWHSEIAAEDGAATAKFDPALVREGAKLAAMGNCIACHTAPGSKAFAGGLALATPFGAIHSTNITPDPETGIGRWSEAAFQRAMREGVGREGRHLYPAFPYDHFTLVSDAVPRSVEVHIVPRPGDPFLGTGEAAQGPVCAALANAVTNAIGKRIHDLPLSRQRVRQAVGV